MPATLPAITRWWWITAAPTPISGSYVGQRDVPPVEVDHSIYELLSSIVPNPKLIYSSPLKRALSPAAMLCQAKDRDVKDVALIDALNEQDFGDWDGKTFAEVQGMIEAEQTISPEDVSDLTPNNGESFNALAQRTQLAIDTILYQVAENAPTAPVDILCTAHISNIRAALAKALGIAPQQTLKIHLQPLSLTVLEHHEQLGWLVHNTGWTPWPMVR